MRKMNLGEMWRLAWRHSHCSNEGEPLEEGGAEAEPAAEDEGVVGKLTRGDADLEQVCLLWTASGDWAGSTPSAVAEPLPHSAGGRGRERCGRPELLLFPLPPMTRRPPPPPPPGLAALRPN